MGGLAAAFTSLSSLPQVKKAWPRQSTNDISLSMLIVLTSGLWLWTVYGILKSDWVIITANVVGGTLSLTILICKLRDMRLRSTERRSRAAKPPQQGKHSRDHVCLPGRHSRIDAPAVDKLADRTQERPTSETTP